MSSNGNSPETEHTPPAKEQEEENAIKKSTYCQWCRKVDSYTAAAWYNHFVSCSKKEAERTAKYRKTSSSNKRNVDELDGDDESNMPADQWQEWLTVHDSNDTTEGLVELFDTIYNVEIDSGKVGAIHLSIPTTYSPSLASFDAFWGCSYRGLQMLISAAVSTPGYSGITLRHGTTPEGRRMSIGYLQGLLQSGWDYKYDPVGHTFFPHGVGETWIGANEVSVVLTVLSIRSELHNFPFKSNGVVAIFRVRDFIYNYFTESILPATGRDIVHSSDGVVRTNNHPLYLQYAGHCLVVVGLEISLKGELRLVVFDSAKDVDILLSDACIENAGGPASPALYIPLLKGATVRQTPLERVTRLTTSSLKQYRVSFAELAVHPDFQILHVISGALMNTAEKRDRKVILPILH